MVGGGWLKVPLIIEIGASVLITSKSKNGIKTYHADISVISLKQIFLTFIEHDFVYIFFSTNLQTFHTQRRLVLHMKKFIPIYLFI